MEDLSNKIQQSINDLKIFFDKINENKENLKLKIQKIFTNIRNILNEREDEILLEVDNQFNAISFYYPILIFWKIFSISVCNSHSLLNSLKKCILVILISSIIWSFFQCSNINHWNTLILIIYFLKKI